ncbi:MAG TPA: hypothetical protein VFR34_03745, partial [Paracoccaceae bacterium]|nr:hypothetical protein [Paracoccaceae bacterium]
GAGFDTKLVRARYTTYHKASLREAEDPFARERDAALDGALSRDGLVFVEGRVLISLRDANFAVIDNIPFEDVEALLDAGPNGWPSILQDLVDRFAGAEGRFVWAIDPPGKRRATTIAGAPGGAAAGRSAEEAAMAFAELLANRGRERSPRTIFTDLIEIRRIAPQLAPEPAPAPVGVPAA